MPGTLPERHALPYPHRVEEDTAARSGPAPATVSVLDGPRAREHVRALAELLRDCVEGGASVGFMPPVSTDRAEAFWHRVADEVHRDARVLLVAHDGTGRVVGTVQLVVDQPENQGHRADVAKLMVHPSARRRGVAGLLMTAVEEEARRRARSLLVLDTETGSAAQALYERAGWQVAGVIPGYALSTDGTPSATTVMFRTTV